MEDKKNKKEKEKEEGCAAYTVIEKDKEMTIMENPVITKIACDENGSNENENVSSGNGSGSSESGSGNGSGNGSSNSGSGNSNNDLSKPFTKDGETNVPKDRQSGFNKEAVKTIIKTYI